MASPRASTLTGSLWSDQETKTSQPADERSSSVSHSHDRQAPCYSRNRDAQFYDYQRRPSSVLTEQRRRNPRLRRVSRKMSAPTSYSVSDIAHQPADNNSLRSDRAQPSFRPRIRRPNNVDAADTQRPTDVEPAHRSRQPIAAGCQPAAAYNYRQSSVGDN